MDGNNSILVHNIDPFDIDFTRIVDADESFTNKDFIPENIRGRTLKSVSEEAKLLGKLPDGLTLNAARYREGGQEVIEAINNRTLYVARTAGLENVTPGNDIDSVNAYVQAQRQKQLAIKSGKNICPR